MSTVEMNYIDVVSHAIRRKVPDCPYDLCALYALLALTTGTGTTAENVHDAWAVWRRRSNPDHPALIPFDGLTSETQALDDPYVAAIRAVAAERDGGAS